MMKRFVSGSPAAVAVALLLGLGACGDSGGPLAMFGGSKPAEGVAPTLPPPSPDSRGVITYANTQVIVARRGDTLQAMAERVGLSGQEIAVHNGLPVTYTPRSGEVFALPRSVGGEPVRASALWSQEIAASAIDASSISTGSLPAAGGSGAATAATARTGDNPFSNGQPDRVVDPIRHRVRSGETAFSIARRYNVSVTALAAWNGLDNEMTVRVDQELLIPVVDGSRPVRVAAAQPATVTDTNLPGTPTPIAPPPSAAAPLPQNQDLAAVVPPPSPNLATVEPIAPAAAAAPAPAPEAPAAAMVMPVPGAKILSGYAPSGPNKNEGIDFAAPAGTAVVAAEAGEVALVSEALGGLGTILLIRHKDNVMTVYGRITGVSLKKGDAVSRGQKIGVVADGKTPNLHFEVRKGTAAVDPAPFLNL